MGSKTVFWVSITTVMLLLQSFTVVDALQVEETLIEIGRDGAAKISMTIKFNQTELSTPIPSLGKPDVFTVKAVSADGTAVPFTIAENHLILNVVGANSPVKLQYFTSTLTSKSGRFWNATLQVAQQSLLKLPSGAVLIGIDGVPEDISVLDGGINLLLGPKAWAVSYFLPPTSLEVTPQPPLLISNILLIFGGLGVVAIALAYFGILKRKKKLHALRPDDSRILDYIKSGGGQAYESDIVRGLDMPKSSVSRAIKRLSEGGLVTVSREGNRVKVGTR